jgi:peroxin-13
MNRYGAGGYSSYNRMGYGGMGYGGGMGGGMYGGGMGYGGANMGYGQFGQNGELPLSQRMEQSTQATFQMLESIVHVSKVCLTLGVWRFCTDA